MKSHLKALLSITTLSACLIATAAEAATIRVQCEVRGNRAKISVDGKDLAAGQYAAAAMSGTNNASSHYQAAVAGEAEFDFDSDPANIAAGATAIPGSFIVNGQVTGKIVNAAGATVISDTVSCRVRSR